MGKTVPGVPTQRNNGCDEPVTGSIPHGTYRGYRTYQCRQHCCLQARRTYEREKRRAQAEGRWNPWGDTQQARAHLQVLRSRGWSTHALAQRTGHDATTLRAMLSNPDRRIHQAITDAIMSVGLDELPPRVPVYRLSRRLRALARQGWGITELSPRIGIGISGLARIRAEHDQHTQKTSAKKILRTYPQLRQTPSPSPRADRVKAMALSQGWLSDIEWDGLIDLSPAELKTELARQVALLDPEELVAAHTAHRRHREWSVVTVAASLEHERRRRATRSKKEAKTHAQNAPDT